MEIRPIRTRLKVVGGSGGNDTRPTLVQTLKAAAKAREKEAAAGQAMATRSAEWSSPVLLDGLPVPERQWIVRDWLPVGSTTLLYGAGGMGKTLLAQQLITACATGGSWVGMPVRKCRAIGLFGEDAPDELHRRQAEINAAMGLTFADLADMRWASGVGADNVLVAPGKDGLGATNLLKQFCAEAVQFGARLVVIDNAGLTFGGNEIVRREVAAFVGQFMNAVAMEINGSVLLLAHPSKSGGAVGGDMTSGSTAWDASVRSRLSLEYPPCPAGEAPDDAERVLRRRKANYAARDASVVLRWADGVLHAPGAGLIEGMRRASAEDAERVFLTLLAGHNAADEFVSGAPSANNYAPRLFARHPDRNGVSKSQFEAAMLGLLARKAIKVETYGRASDERRRLLVVVDEVTSSNDPDG